MEIDFEELLIALTLKEKGLEWGPKKGDWFAHHVHFPEYKHLGYFNVGQVQENGKIPDDDEYSIYDEDTWLPTITQIESILRIKGIKVECFVSNGTYRVQMGDLAAGEGSTKLAAYYRAFLYCC